MDPDSTESYTLFYEPIYRHDGDVNDSGVITAGDAQIAFYMVLGIIEPIDLSQSCAADCNGSGIITAGDVQDIMGAVFGWGGCVDQL